MNGSGEDLYAEGYDDLEYADENGYFPEDGYYEGSDGEYYEENGEYTENSSENYRE